MGPHQNSRSHTGKLYRKLCKAETVWRAWAVVLENGRASKSRRTRTEIAEFLADAPRQIQSILWRLQRQQYTFAPAHGVAMLKKNGVDKRPIVMAPVSNRIVQRAILDVVQSIPAIKERLCRRHNFGGIDDVGVPDAVKEVYLASRRGAYFIRTDIKAFFDNIPRQKAVSLIAQETNDEALNAILEAATNTELDNLNQLGRDGELFPLENIGVAQGSALSPLLCNLLLADLDERMNNGHIVCVRYIDDFILIGPNRRMTVGALKSARRALKDLHPKLDCYDPTEYSGKAEEGNTSSEFQFLGCQISPDAIRPSRLARDRLLHRVNDVFSEALFAAANPRNAIQERKSYPDTLNVVSNIIRGWGNTYSFCTDDRIMAYLDNKVDEMIFEFSSRYHHIIEKQQCVQDKRRLERCIFTCGL